MTGDRKTSSPNSLGLCAHFLNKSVHWIDSLKVLKVPNYHLCICPFQSVFFSLSPSTPPHHPRCILVLLEQQEDGDPCVLTLSCGPQPPALISSLLVVSEARTMEVYAQTGDYCGTCRGERDHAVQPDR